MGAPRRSKLLPLRINFHSAARSFSSKCARKLAKCAKKSASLKCKFFIAFLDVSEDVQKLIFKIFFGKCQIFKFLCSKILQFSYCAIFLAFCAMRESTLKVRERGVQMRHFRAIAQDLAALNFQPVALNLF